MYVYNFPERQKIPRFIYFERAHTSRKGIQPISIWRQLDPLRLFIYDLESDTMGLEALWTVIFRPTINYWVEFTRPQNMCRYTIFVPFVMSFMLSLQRRWNFDAFAKGLSGYWNSGYALCVQTWRRVIQCCLHSYNRPDMRSLFLYFGR